MTPNGDTFERCDRGIWRRRAPSGESLFAAGPTDHSPQHIMYPDGYDSRCTSCWLNHGHSDAQHAASIAAADASATGYRDCACRDCFELTIGRPGYCDACTTAGCPDAMPGECRAPHAYGGDAAEGD